MTEKVLIALGSILGGGVIGQIAQVYFQNKGKNVEVELSKDDKAFNILESRIKRLETEMGELKTELKIKDELVDQLKEQNILLKYENKELKEENRILKGGRK